MSKVVDMPKDSEVFEQFKTTEENYAWFQANLSSLESQYGGQYIVIKNESIVGAYPTFQIAFESVKGKEKPETYIIQLCSSDESKVLSVFHSMVTFA